MPYISRAEVLIEAGQLNLETAKPLQGAADGSNTTFTVEHFPIVDKNFDDTVSGTDVVVYDDGISASISSITKGSGTIVLTTAPAADSVMTVDYAHNSTPVDFVDMLIEQTEDWINTVMAKVETTPYTSPNATIKKIARYYAAGMLISQGYGLSSPNDDDLREGKAKIDQAEAWLMQHKTQVESNASIDAGVDLPQVSEDRRIFEDYNSVDGWQPLDDADVDFNTTTNND